MRKNFLILMLMALLPLVGNAKDISEITNVDAGQYTYGDGTTAVSFFLTDDIALVEGTHFTVESTGTDYNYYKEATFETKVATGLTGRATLEVGTYYLKINGIGAFSGTVACPVRIDKAPLHLSINGGTALHTVYGTPYTMSGTITYTTADASELKNGDALETAVTGTITAVNYTGTAATKNSTGGALSPAKDAYDLTFEGLTSKNYALICTGGMDVWQKSIVDGTALDDAITITATGNNVTYNGSAQQPTFTLSLNGTALTAEEFAANFTVSKASGDNVNVGTATFTVAAIATGNFAGTYAGTVAADDLDTYKLVIGKAGLRVAGATQTKKYDGTITLVPGEDSYTVTGLQGTDALSDIATIKAEVTSGTAAGVGTKTITVSKTADGSKIGNYDLNLVNGTLTIEPRPITITAKDASKKYNQADEDATGFISAWPTSVSDPTAKGDISAKGYSGVTVGYTGDDTKAPFAAGDGLKFFGEKKSSGDAKNYAGIYVAKKSGTSDNKGEYEGALEVKVTNSSAPALTNYDITYVAGKYTIAGGKIYVTAEAKTKEYGDEDPELTYVVDGLSEGDALTTAPTLTRAEGEDASQYLITPAGAVAPDGYEEIVYATAKLTITKAPLTVTLPIQTLATTIADDAAAIAALDKTGIIVDGFKKDETAASSYELSMNSVTYGSDATFANGYKLTLTTAIKTNYQIKTGEDTYADNITGKVVIGNGAAGTLALTSIDADAATIASKAEETQTVTIQFGPRNGRNYGSGDTYSWKAGQWTTMVLPFDISVSDLSKALGYAIVNVIDPTRTTVSGEESKFYGKLTMKGGNGNATKLAANKPFLIKLAEDIDGTTAYNFGSQKIVAADDLSVYAGEGAKFVGTYATKTVTKDDDAAIWFMNGDEDGWQFIGSSSTATWSIVPFEAYIDMSTSSAPRNIIFYAEEIDGSVTAIKGISTDAAAKAKVAEGWYTINGVKLNAAPTQKGIYINNGKKFVVK